MPILAIHPLTIRLQFTGKQDIQTWTERHTTGHGPCVTIGQGADSVKTIQGSSGFLKMNYFDHPEFWFANFVKICA